MNKLDSSSVFIPDTVDDHETELIHRTGHGYGHDSESENVMDILSLQTILGRRGSTLSIILRMVLRN